MTPNQRMVLDALALEIWTAPEEHRFAIWRMFEYQYETSFRRAYPDASHAMFISMFAEASAAVLKRLSELQDGAQPVGHC